MAETLLLRAEKEDAGASGSQRAARCKRISNLWSLALQRKLSELSAHVEAAVIEVGHLCVHIWEACLNHSKTRI